jgi:flagellar hook-length control protein FliK
MIAQHVNAVAADMKVSLAQQPGGRGVASFIDHLGAAKSANFTSSLSRLGASTALGTSLSTRKSAAKTSHSNNDANTTSNAANQATPATPPVAVPQSQQAPSDASSKMSASSATASTPVVSATDTKQAAANVQVAASLGTGSNVQLGAPVQASTFNQAGLPIVSGAAGDSSSDQATALATQGAAATATQPALPADATQQQITAGANTIAGQQLGSLGLVAANQVDQTVPTSLKPPTAPANPQTSATPQAGQKDRAAPATGANAPVVAASDTQPTADTTDIPMPSGAAELGARIVAGANKLSAQPDSASTKSADGAAPVADANASVMPNPIAAPTPADKSQRAAERLPNAADPTATNASANQTNGDADFHGIVAALNHNAATRDNSPASDGDETKKLATVGTDAGAATTNATAPTPQTNTAPPSAAAPGDTAARPGMIAVPAGEQVAIHLKQAIKNGADEIQIQLKPASLGAIDVKLNVNHDGKLTAVISADRSDTLNLLKQDSGNLQQALRDAGFNADSSSLSFNLRGDSQSFAQNARPQGYAGSSGSSLGDDIVAPVAPRGLRQHSGSIDIEA